MRPQRKLLTPALEKRASQPGAGTALVIDIMQTIGEPLLVLDLNLGVISANRSFYNFFKVTPEKTAGKHIYDLGNRQWDILELRTLLEDIIAKNNSFDNYEIEHEFLGIGRKTVLLNARCINQEEITPPPPKAKVVLLAIEDVTDRREIENGLGKARKELEATKISKDKAREYSENIIDTVHESLIALDQDLRLVEPKDFRSSPLAEAMPICCNISREGVLL